MGVDVFAGLHRAGADPDNLTVLVDELSLKERANGDFVAGRDWLDRDDLGYLNCIARKLARKRDLYVCPWRDTRDDRCDIVRRVQENGHAPVFQCSHFLAWYVVRYFGRTDRSRSHRKQEPPCT